jgi:hypothetical protein
VYQDPAMSRIDLSAMSWAWPLTQVGTAVTLVWEWAAPVILLLYWFRHTHDRPGRLRAWCNRRPVLPAFLSIGAVMHLAIAATMGLGIFSWAMLAHYVAFVHPDAWPDRLRAPRTRSA